MEKDQNIRFEKEESDYYEDLKMIAHFHQVDT